MSTTTDLLLADAEKYGPTAIQVIASALAALGVGGEPAIVLQVVAGMLKVFGDGVTAGASPMDIAGELAKFQPGLAVDDANADAMVKAKFAP